MKNFAVKRTTVRWAPRVNQFVRFPLVNPYGRPRPALPRAGPLPLQLVVYLIRPSWAHCRRPLARPRACHKASLAIVHLDLMLPALEVALASPRLDHPRVNAFMHVSSALRAPILVEQYLRGIATNSVRLNSYICNTH